jgi:hypothetical protein
VAVTDLARERESQARLDNYQHGHDDALVAGAMGMHGRAAGRRAPAPRLPRHRRVHQLGGLTTSFPNDIYSDYMVRRFEQDNVPLERIDNSAFMIGTTGTC